MWLGGVHISRRRYKQAIAYLQQQLTISIQTDNQCQKYSALYYLGSSYFLLGQAQPAIECLGEALNFARETASKTTEAAILSVLGGVYSTCLKQYEDAIECFEQVLRLYREMGNRAKEANVMSDLSYCYSCLKHHTKAIEYSQQALTIACETGDREAKASALASLANVYWHQKQYVRALWVVVQSLLILPPSASPNGELIFRQAVKEIAQLGKKVIKR
jgi:tetratricopeptide (TPR) repeat protein